MQFSLPTSFLQFKFSLICVNVRPWNICMYYLPLFNVRSKASFQHLITSANNKLRLNIVRHNYIFPWECCFFLDRHLWMNVKYELKQHSQSNNSSYTGNSQAEVSPSPSTGKGQLHYWCHGEKRDLLCYRKRGKYSRCTQRRTYAYAVHVPYEQFRKDTAFWHTHMHALPLC